MAAFKTHISLQVSALHRSIEFYRVLLGSPPVKRKPDYAKFDVEAPALNLTLIQNESISSFSDTSLSHQSLGAISHFGIQVERVDDVQHAIAHFKAAGLDVREEFDTDCCYALQDKVWVADPDGNHWEIFVVKVTDTAPELAIDSGSGDSMADKFTSGDSISESAKAAARTCCTPSCCV